MFFAVELTLSTRSLVSTGGGEGHLHLFDAPAVFLRGRGERGVS